MTPSIKSSNVLEVEMGLLIRACVPQVNRFERVVGSMNRFSLKPTTHIHTRTFTSSPQIELTLAGIPLLNAFSKLGREAAWVRDLVRIRVGLLGVI